MDVVLNIFLEKRVHSYEQIFKILPKKKKKKKEQGLGAARNKGKGLGRVKPFENDLGYSPSSLQVKILICNRTFFFWRRQGWGVGPALVAYGSS